MNKGIWIGLGLLVLLLAACGSGVNTDQPPEILYGQDVCHRCNMIINEERFAAAYWTAEGEARRFDDIGGMLAYVLESPEEVASYWVHDANTVEWLRADDAFFLLDPALQTPMGFSIAAYADKATAGTMAGDSAGVMVMDFKTLLSRLESGELELDPTKWHDHDE
jgi:copper chaperone NosL